LATQKHTKGSLFDQKHARNNGDNAKKLSKARNIRVAFLHERRAKSEKEKTAT